MREDVLDRMKAHKSHSDSSEQDTAKSSVVTHRPKLPRLSSWGQSIRSRLSTSSLASDASGITDSPISESQSQVPSPSQSRPPSPVLTRLRSRFVRTNSNADSTITELEEPTRPIPAYDVTPQVPELTVSPYYLGPHIQRVSRRAIPPTQFSTSENYWSKNGWKQPDATKSIPYRLERVASAACNPMVPDQTGSSPSSSTSAGDGDIKSTETRDFAFGKPNTVTRPGHVRRTAGESPDIEGLSESGDESGTIATQSADLGAASQDS